MMRVTWLTLHIQSLNAMSFLLAVKECMERALMRDMCALGGGSEEEVCVYVYTCIDI